MRKQIGATVLALAMACSLMAGCSSGSGETTAAATTEAAKEESKEEAKDEAKDTSAEAENAGSEEGSGKKYVIGLAMNTQTNPFFVDVKDGVQKAADEHGIELYITDEDPTIQRRIGKPDVIELLQLRRGRCHHPDEAEVYYPPCHEHQTNPFFVDAISVKATVFADTDAQDDPTIQMKDPITKNGCYSIVSSIEACNEAGIPVFTMDREANGGEVISHIGYDAIKSGRMAGQYLVDTLGGKGKIVEIQGIMGTNVAQNRSQGFNEVMKDNPDMEIVACQVADFDRAKGMSVMENILQANPEIDGLYAANDEMLLGALEAMEAAGRTDEIVKIGCDAIDDTLDAMKAGKVDATIAEPPFFLGKAILNTAYDYLEGKQVEPYVILDNQLVTQDTVDSLVTKE